MQLCLLHSWPCCHFHAEIKLNKIGLPTPPPNMIADMGNAPSGSLLIKCLLTETAVVALKDSSPVQCLGCTGSVLKGLTHAQHCALCASLCALCASLCAFRLLVRLVNWTEGLVPWMRMKSMSGPMRFFWLHREKIHRQSETEEK